MFGDGEVSVAMAGGDMLGKRSRLLASEERENAVRRLAEAARHRIDIRESLVLNEILSVKLGFPKL